MHSKKRNEFHNGNFSLIPITDEKTFKSEEIAGFDCGKDDLNEFFQVDAYAHHEQLLAVTYYFQPKEATDREIFYPVALVSLLNDRIEITREERQGIKKKFGKSLKKGIPYPKRNYTSFPAVKIGRLGVSKQFQGQDIGTSLLNMIKNLFLTHNRTGCRYLTVDAYREALPFYDKNEFEPLWEKDKEDQQRILYYDLKRFSF
ncbi:MAG: GNAT family N-acetyltransferase [Desulfamplus sp.]|nr:GNAT family N-acetyltransferase [Desulfamplus sp.]